MPHNAKGAHYANPAYGKMMEGGKAKDYAAMGYMLKRLEVEYAENGFVVKCYWEEPKSKKGGASEPMAYMEPTIKVFETQEAMAKFVGSAFNEYRHGKKMKGGY